MNAEIEQRRRELEDGLPKAVANLVANFRPECIIVYGSYVTGEVGEWSDLDLCVIKDHNKDWHTIHMEAREAMGDIDADVDLAVCTPEAWLKELSEGNYFVVEEILGKGRVLYGKPPGLDGSGQG